MRYIPSVSSCVRVPWCRVSIFKTLLSPMPFPAISFLSAFTAFKREISRKSSFEAAAVPLFLPKAEFLLYSPYGMGLTAVCLYLLLVGLGIKGLRGRSLLFLVLCFCGVFACLLNGNNLTEFDTMGRNN